MVDFFKINEVKIEWLGHASFKITTDDITIYIDPYAGTVENYSQKANLVLISHDHYDHCDTEKIQLISNDNTKIISSKSCANKLKDINSNLNTQSMSSDEKITIEEVEITAIPAYNISKKFHPKNAGGLGFIFTISDVKIYFAGDTDFIPEMKNLASQNIDVALLPVGGTFTMNCTEAGLASNAIHAQVVIPMHHGLIPGLEMNIEKFKEKMDNSTKIILLEPKIE